MAPKEMATPVLVVIMATIVGMGYGAMS